jgi:acyl-CoA thioesterase
MEHISMNVVMKHFKKDKLAAHLGMELLEVSPGHATVRMTVEERHLNSIGGVHGGTFFTLADFAFAVASNTHGNVSVSVSASMAFHRAATLGCVLTAVAREVSRSRKLGSYQVDITNEEGELLATFQGLAYAKRETITDFTPE